MVTKLAIYELHPKIYLSLEDSTVKMVIICIQIMIYKKLKAASPFDNRHSKICATRSKASDCRVFIIT